MPKTRVIGVGDPIQIPSQPPAPDTGTILWTAEIPAGEKWTLENLIYNWGAPDAQAGKLVFHVFVKDSVGVSLSPIWDYAWLQSQHPEWWRPQMREPHMPVYGPATVTVLAVNTSTAPCSLYWSAIWSLEP